MTTSPQPPNFQPAALPSNPVVNEWLQKAIADMDIASRELLRGLIANHDAICFHAQQGAEKIIKAVLISGGTQPPFTHDMQTLSALLTTLHPQWAWDAEELKNLTFAAVQYRYPGVIATFADAQHALDVAHRMWPVLIALL